MGVKLDWQIEAERAYQKAGEDPQERARRRMQRARIIAFTAGFAGCICVIAALVWYRLYTVDNKLKQDLINTVQAETAALRIGDLAGFMAIQRTAPGSTWYEEESARFKRYQDLKTKSDLKLLGNVIDATVDGPRGRVLIEEVIDNVPYRTVWFYWRYNDGWRHVPTDFTFWGEATTAAGKSTAVKYNKLDTALGQALVSRVDDWWTDGCNILGCRDLPKLTVEVAAELSQQPRWDFERPNTLIIPSPLASEDRARADVSITPTLEEAVAVRLAEQLFNVSTGNLRPVQTADAAWIRQMAIEWLAASFIGRGDPDRLSFMQSLKDHYGQPALAAVVRALSPNADISIIGTALKQPIESLALDWRMFFQWRLDVEKTLLNPGRQDTNAFQALWDTANPQALEQMRLRQSRPTQATPQVQSVAITRGTDGVARANVAVSADNKPQTIIFRLVNGAWKRSA
ncbi:MAG: hypothetical protein IT324_14030 [Anaerolineae bacterium]|nr:hypothetical protein [Anaerolineae bacterium]